MRRVTRVRAARSVRVRVGRSRTVQADAKTLIRARVSHALRDSSVRAVHAWRFPDGAGRTADVQGLRNARTTSASRSPAERARRLAITPVSPYPDAVQVTADVQGLRNARTTSASRSPAGRARRLAITPVSPYPDAASRIPTVREHNNVPRTSVSMCPAPATIPTISIAKSKITRPFVPAKAALVITTATAGRKGRDAFTAARRAAA